MIDFENFVKSSPIKPDKTFMNIQKNERKYEKTPIKQEKILKTSPEKMKIPMNPTILVENQKKNFKENIKKLKEIYYDKNFIERMGKEEKNEVFVKNSSQKSNNLHFSLNFSDSNNFSSPIFQKFEQNNDLFSSSHEKNNSFVKRIDFDSELNYSVSQKNSPLRESIETDPILSKLRIEAQNINEEIE